VSAILATAFVQAIAVGSLVALLSLPFPSLQLQGRMAQQQSAFCFALFYIIEVQQCGRRIAPDGRSREQ
jgi:hypothetical protein